MKALSRICAGGVGALALMLSGCAAPTLYYWGGYQNVVYGSFKSPDKMTPDMQVYTLTADIEQAAKANLPVAPGVRAQLGLAYLAQGNVAAAREQFLLEKKNFPESATYMDNLIAKLPKS